LIVPWEVSAVKFGASSFMRNIDLLLIFRIPGRGLGTLVPKTMATNPLTARFSESEL